MRPTADSAAACIVAAVAFHTSVGDDDDEAGDFKLS